jgi:catechol 2,3-dioxygenase
MPFIDSGVDIGHVHLRVADLDRAIGFYRDVLGFDLQTKMPGAAFLSAGGYHHHIGLNTWESRGGSPPPRGSTGLYHFAIRYPTRRALADALRRLRRARVSLDGASDHGVSEALYLHTRMGTASSSTGIAPAINGRAGRTARSRWSRPHSTSTA